MCLLTLIKHFASQRYDAVTKPLGKKFSIKAFFSKYDKIQSFLWIWSHILKKFLMENFTFCGVILNMNLLLLERDSHVNWKSTDKCSFTCLKSVLKILHSNYLQFCSNLPVKFAVFLKKKVQCLTVSVIFSVYKQNVTAE